MAHGMVAHVRTKTTRTRSAHARRRSRAGILFVLPSAVFVGVFFIVPLLMTVWMSLNDWSLLGTPHFIGLANYSAVLGDGQFWSSLGFTTKYTLIVTPPIFLVAFGLAVLVRQPRRGVGIFRTAFFLPVVVGLATASLLWIFLLNDQVGVVNGVLQGLGVIHDPVEWFADPTSALLVIAVMVVWKTAGLAMILLLVGLQAIPAELYEAARVDGAGWWARLRYITLPLLRRTFALALVISVIGSFLAFEPFYIITQGGPINSTITVVYWIYNTAFTYFRLGYGATLSLVLLLILVAISVAQLYLLRDDTRY